MRTRPVLAGVTIVIGVLMALVVRNRPRAKPATPVVSRTGVQPSNVLPPAAGTVPQPIHGEHELVTQILEQGLTPERAKLLFSMVVGDLPGVSVPAGSRNSADFDGTLAVGYIIQEWDSLTPAQRSAAAHLIHPSDTSSGGKQSSSAGSHPMVLPVAYVRATDAPAFDYEAMGNVANNTLSAFLKQPPVVFTVPPDFGPASGTEYAHTWSFYKTPEHPTEGPDLPYVTGCEIVVRDQLFRALSQTDAQAIVTHEMFHCYQQRVTGSAVAWWQTHPWILEGEATWAMQVVVPGASDMIMGPKWAPYLADPKMHFVTRSYDAVGVYAHMADLAGDAAVWPKLLPMVKTAIGGGQNDIDAFNLLTQGTQITYFTDWGSSYFEVDQRTPWEILNRYPPKLGGLPPQSVTVDGHTVEMLPAAGPYEGELFQLTGSADVVIVGLLSGYGRLHDEQFAIDEALDADAPLALCLKSGGCKCPDGSPGASLFTKNAVAPLSIGVNGGDKGMLGGVAGESLDKFCKQPDPPEPPGSLSGGGGAGAPGGDMGSPDTLPDSPSGESRGDVHMVTFDGLHYNFQVVGEYTLVKSTKDDFVVQVRAVPVRGTSALSMNQAIATTLNGHRVTVSIENANEVLRVDGKEVLGPPPPPVRGAVLCTETMYGSSCQLNWPDGTVVRATQIERFALNVVVQPARARLGALAGLLGDGDGSTANDLVGMGGAQLGAQPSEQDINHSLAKTWRVPPGASLFDYLPGQSSRTFADTTFPRAGADAARLANRDSAEKTCRQEGITDAHLLDDCILDLAATNNFAYASAYSHAQRTMDARAALRQIAIPGVLRTLVKDGTITDKSQQPLFTFEAKDSDVMWIDSTGCQDAHGTIHVDILWHFPADTSAWDAQMNDLPGTGQHSYVPACRAGRVPEFGGIRAGTVALLANPHKDETGTFHIPVRFVRPDRVRAITYGATVDGTIENAGVHDVYTFPGHSGDIIRISGDGCDLGRLVTGILVLGSVAEQGPSCSGNDFTLPALSADARFNDTTYKLVVNWANNAAAPTKYHFVFRGVGAK